MSHSHSQNWKKNAFSTSSGGRQNVPDIAIVLWDGGVRADFDDALKEAIDLRQLGVRLLVIGVGTEVYELGLESVASWPSDDTVFVVRSGSNLTTITDLVVQSTCNGRSHKTLQHVNKTSMTLHHSPLHHPCFFKWFI